MSRTSKPQCYICYRVQDSPLHDTSAWAEAHCKRCRESGGHPVWNGLTGGVSSDRVHAHHPFMAFPPPRRTFPAMAGVTFGDD